MKQEILVGKVKRVYNASRPLPMVGIYIEPSRHHRCSEIQYKVYLVHERLGHDMSKAPV